MIGTAFEYLIKNFSADSGKKGDHYFTPAEVSELVAELVSPRAGDEICDPTCGSGSLLLKCGQQVHKYFNSKKYALYGQEAIGSTWALARMNLYLHGEDNHRIEWGDTISNPRLLDAGGRLRKFDVVVANPPFSQEKWGYDSAIGDKFGRFRRGIPPKARGDYAFILHMLETLKPGTGRMGVVVPNGVLFRGSGERILRQKLVDENLLDAVIGLPEKLFYGTGISAAILLFRKQKRNKTVLFIDASRQFLDGKSHNILREEDIARVVAAYEAGNNDGKYAHLATHDEIRANDYNLNIPRYIDPFEDNETINLEAVRREREQLKMELEKLEPEMAAYLEELGYDPQS
jgi:type I restriction enzyme M protein